MVLAVLLSACSTGSSTATGSPSGKLAVVAAEDVWGSIARQLRGTHADVHSLISNPDTDRHHADFETALRPYRSTIADIKAKYAGTPVGASESVFAPLAADLGLHLVTP